MKTMLVPREHGAWGMLLVPLATGAVVAARVRFHGLALALFVIVTVSLFWLRTPLEAWLGTSPIKAQTRNERASVSCRRWCCCARLRWPPLGRCLPQDMLVDCC